MAKITNIRERVHQPLRDALIRTSGNYVSNVQDRTDLFTVAGGDQGKTNLQNGSTLPSDQSMVVLALRTFLWFRNPQLRAEDAAGNVTFNGDLLESQFVQNTNTSIGSAQDAHRLYFQASEQLLWSVGAGQKYSLTSMPSSYFPYAGGLHGRLPKASGTVCCNVYTSTKQSPYLLPNNSSVVCTLQPGSCCPGDNVVVTVQQSIPIDPTEPPAYKIVAILFVPGGGAPELLLFEEVSSLPATFTMPKIPGGPPCVTFTLSDFQVLTTGEFNAVNLQFSSCSGASMVHWNNGTPEASALTRLARAILIPPRQNILVSAQIVSYADNPQNPVATQGSRNLLSLTSNLNQQDYINKCITMTLDGLLSRDVQ